MTREQAESYLSSSWAYWCITFFLAAVGGWDFKTGEQGTGIFWLCMSILMGLVNYATIQAARKHL